MKTSQNMKDVLKESQLLVYSFCEQIWLFQFRLRQ